MGFHHIAFATRDTEATHHFYTELMGFTLVKTNVSPTPGPQGGWSKHFFYDTSAATGAAPGSGMIAFWEIHDPVIGTGFEVDLNTHAGLPGWVNHYAFDSPTSDHLAARRDVWRAHGHTVVEIDHDFCTSIYTTDPNGNMVEFCHTTRDFTPEERANAVAILHDPAPAMEPHEAKITVHPPLAADASA
jgi:catechol 2,3-dioxygenase-like lactoylglutathione lyase family enzyme